MSEQAVQTQDSEARLFAAVSHAAILFQTIGIVVALLIYILQKDKSRFAAFQALQAAVYQLVVMGASIVLWMCWGVCYFASFVPIMADPSAYNDAPPPTFWIGFGSMIIPLGLMVIGLLYGLFGALRTLQGADFRYIGVGRWLERSGMLNNRPAGSSPAE